MGNCSQTSKRHESSSVLNEDLPSFTYLSRSQQTLLISHKGKTEAFSFTDCNQIHPDSLVSHISSTYLIILGGTDPLTSQPSNKAFAINSVHLTFQPLPDLPIGLSKGNIFYEGNQIIVFNHSSPQVFTYTLDASEWSEVEVSFSHSKYKKLANFSSYMQGQFIYLISSFYGSALNDRVYRMSIRDWKLEKSDEVFEGRLRNPRCFASGNTVVVGAGYKEDGSPNTDFFCRRSDNPWEKIEGPEIGEYEDYPFALNKTIPIFFAKSQIVVKFPHRFWVFTLNIPTSLLPPKYTHSSRNSTDHPIITHEKKPENSPKLSEESEESTANKLKTPENNENPRPNTNNIETEREYMYSIKNHRLEDVQVVKVKAIAPFLPSNIARQSYLDSESSFTESVYEN